MRANGEAMNASTTDTFCSSSPSGDSTTTKSSTRGGARCCQKRIVVDLISWVRT